MAKQHWMRWQTLLKQMLCSWQLASPRLQTQTHRSVMSHVGLLHKVDQLADSQDATEFERDLDLSKLACLLHDAHLLPEVYVGCPCTACM